MTRALVALALAGCADQADWEGALAFHAAVADLAICETPDGDLSVLATATTRRNCKGTGVPYTSVREVTCEDTLDFLRSLDCAVDTPTLTSPARSALFLHSAGVPSLDALVGLTFEEGTLFQCTEQVDRARVGDRFDLSGVAQVASGDEAEATLSFDHPDLTGTLAVRVCRGALREP